MSLSELHERVAELFAELSEVHSAIAEKTKDL
jgi:hypothetical protein